MIKEEQVNARKLRILVRQMSQAFRDSMGGGLFERVEEISKLLYCKMYDEKKCSVELDYKRKFFRYAGENIEDTYLRIVDLYEESIILLPELLDNGQWRLSEDKKAIVRVVEILQGIMITSIPEDVKGVVFEEIIHNTLDKSENQQYFTPRTVVEFMVKFVNPQPGLRICDPACGSGGFLIDVSNHILKNSAGSMGNNTHLIGIEIDWRMAWIAKMNLIMHGDGNGVIYYNGDGGSLSFNENIKTLIPDNSIDIILTNPPFGSDYSDHEQLKQYILGKGKLSRRRGVLFIERCIRMLKPQGKLGIIIDESVLNNPSNSDVRDLILDTCDVEAVISLPEVTFMPYASVKSSILFLVKNQEKKVYSDIFMANVEHVGRKSNGDPDYSYDKDLNGKPVLNNDLTNVVNAWIKYQADGYSSIQGQSTSVYMCPAERLKSRKPSNRMDVLYHHPSRNIAETTLSESLFTTVSLSEIITIRHETFVPSKSDPEEIWNYIGLANIKPETGEYEVSKVFGSQLKSSVRIFKPGDILFAKLRPALRKCVLINSQDGEGLTSSECLVFTANIDVNGEYLSILLRSDLVFGQLIYQITGVGRPRVNKNVVYGLKIPLPPISLQNKIVELYKLNWKKHLIHKMQSQAEMEMAKEVYNSTYDQILKTLVKSI